MTVQNCNLDNNSATVRGGALNIGGGDNCTVINVSLSNNKAGTYGGAAYVIGDNAFFDNVTSKNNTAGNSGGSSYIAGNNVVVQNSILDNNTATSFGGGLYVEGNNCNFTNNDISRNIAYSGGGIDVEGDNALFTYNNITFNEAQNNEVNPSYSSGGGVAIQGENATFIHNNISSNVADETGGGLITEGDKLYLEDIYGFNNTAENGGFAQIMLANNLTVKNSTFISNHATGDISRERGGGGAIHVSGSLGADIQANFYNNTATNGSAIYVQDLLWGLYPSSVNIHDSRFFDNQAHSYYLLAAPKNGTTYHVGDDKIVCFSHIGGDNFANAIHNWNGESDITIRNITFPFYHNGVEEIRTTPNEDLIPVLGHAKFNGTNIYLDELEDNQPIYYEVYDNKTGKLIRNGSAITDINGSIDIDLSDLGVGVYLIKAWYNETTYYTEISNETIIIVIDDGIDLSIIKKVNITGIYVGDSVAWNLTVVNKGSKVAENVYVKDTIPTGLQIDRTKLPENCTVDGQNVIWKIGSMQANETRSIVLITKALTNGTFMNVAVVNTTSNETNKTNNKANNTTVVYLPNMTIQKITLNRTVYVGNNVTFEIIVKNVGDCNLSDVVAREFFNSTE